MIWMDPSDTSSLLEIMTNLMSGKKNQGNCKTQGGPVVSKKLVVTPSEEDAENDEDQ